MKAIITTLGLLVLSVISYSQNGVRISYGDQSILDESYSYSVILMSYNHPLWSKNSNKTRLSLQALPQFGLSYAISDTLIQDQNGIELGINVQLEYALILSKYYSIYGALGVGPHYISSTISRQARGFIFSDNFILGNFIRISDALKLDISIGYRHLSNASLRQPNKGINTVMYSIGLRWVAKS